MPMLKTQRIITELNPVPVSDRGRLSLGGFVDEVIARAVANEEVLQSVELLFEPAEWENITKGYS